MIFSENPVEAHLSSILAMNIIVLFLLIGLIIVLIYHLIVNKEFELK
jgi:hypothetical protein